MRRINAVKVLLGDLREYITDIFEHSDNYFISIREPESGEKSLWDIAIDEEKNSKIGFEYICNLLIFQYIRTEPLEHAMEKEVFVLGSKSSVSIEL